MKNIELVGFNGTIKILIGESSTIVPEIPT
jgi:hypothetical protein